MAQKTRTQLTTQSSVIRNETTPKANTKVRIADMVDAISESSLNALDDIADQATAVAGTNNTKFMTPLRVTQRVQTLIDSISSLQNIGKLSSAAISSMLQNGKIGVLYDKSSWTSGTLASDFEATGFTPTVNGDGHIVFTGGTSDYNKYLKILPSQFTSTDPNMTVEVTFTLEAGSGGTNGLAVGKKSINGAPWVQTVLAQIVSSGGMFMIKQGTQVNFASGIITQGSTASYSEGDTVTIAYQQRNNRINFLVNSVESLTATDSLTDPSGNGGNQFVPNTSTPTIWNALDANDVVTIKRIRVISDSYSGGIAWFADSKNWYYANGFNNVVTEQLAKGIGIPITNFGGSGDIVTSFLSQLYYIQNYLKPTLAIMCVGRNNIGDAITNYQTLFNGISSASKYVIGCYGVPEPGLDQSSLNAKVLEVHGASNTITWTGFNTATMVGPDNIHENSTGHIFRGAFASDFISKHSF